MGMGVSLFLIAVGAIMEWAVDVNTRGANIHTIGLILMVVGAIGLLFSFLFLSSFAPFASHRETYVEREREVL